VIFFFGLLLESSDAPLGNCSLIHLFSGDSKMAKCHVYSFLLANERFN